MVQINQSFVEELTNNEQLVMLRYLLASNQDGDVIGCSERMVAMNTDIPYQQVRTIRRRLEKKGLIKNYSSYMSICESELYKVSTKKGSKVSDPQMVEKKKKEEMLKRRDVFTESMKAYADTYPRDMLNDFWRYWTEPNKSQTKMRFEMQKTWDLGRRLITWENRNAGKYKQ